ncbi:MAG: DUF1800 domain-containing protein [Planctomycetes bacterium]|nr:DUF1800 domain-containing protein [Planctomycetota bacterium]
MSSFAIPLAGAAPTGNPPVSAVHSVPELEPWKPTPADPWDRAKAAHLARRAGFGARSDEVDAMLLLGPDRFLDLLLTPDPIPLQNGGMTVLPNGEVLNLSGNPAHQRAQWLHEMATGSNPLREKMCLFWHDHFSVGVNEPNAQPTMPAHINLFRRLGLGTFRDLLIEVTKDAAMLYWLDNYLNGQNRGGVPLINENYGRELLELYSMGVNGGYTQNDVVEASKCLSGWTLLGRNTSFYRTLYHVTGQKTVLGTVISHADGAQDLPRLIDVILAWPATARYMVEKFWRWFVDDAPSPAVLDALANRWRADGFRIRSLMSILLRSRAFFAPTAVRKLISSPCEFAVRAIRITRTAIGSYTALGTGIERMGLPLLRYTNPSGLAEGTAWIDSQTLITRANFADQLTAITQPAAGIEAVFDPFFEVNRAGLTTATQIVDHWLSLLVDGAVPSVVRTNLIGFMNTDDAGPAPFTGTPAQIQRKVRGLVHLILALPEAQMN